MSLLPSLPSFDDPIELLYACHDNVRRFTRALEQLAQRPSTERQSEQCQQIARQVLNYFDRAAPHHHADEEADLFPALRRLNDTELNQSIDRLLREHVQMSAAWQRIRPALQAVAQGQAAELGGAAEFAALYGEHAAFEDEVIYPIALQRLDESVLQTLGHAMAARRGAPPPRTQPLTGE